MSDTLPAGTMIAGRYELDQLIGAGGAGRVYSAVDQRLHRRVAIKLVSVDQAQSADPASTARFVDEARTGARFVHPNAVTVFDAGSSDEYLYLVTELVEGTNLAQYIDARGPLPIEHAARIGDQILGALAAAHAAGIVHRDVKPSNVLLDANGDAKLADFGIAKRLDDVESSLTAEGHFVGTPRYASPEQAAGRPATAATDVYAAGVVLFEMLTGRAVYEGENPVAVATAHQTAPIPDVRSIRPEISPELAAVVRKALAKSPADRFVDASAMRAELHAAGSRATGVAQTRAYPVDPMAATSIQHTEGPSAQDRLVAMSADTIDDGARSGSRRGTWLWVALAGLVAIALAIAALADRGDGGSGESPEGPARSTAAQLPGTVAARTTVPSSTAAPTTAPPSTTPPTTAVPSTTPAPSTTTPALAAPTDLVSLIGFVAQSSDGGEKQTDLLVELQKLQSLDGNKLREEADKVIEKAAEWAEKDELDPTLADYTIEILDDIVQPGEGRDGDEGDDD